MTEARETGSIDGSTESAPASLSKAAVLDSATKIVQVLSVVVGVVVSVLSFNSARDREAQARIAEDARRQTEAARPFLELRQKLYLEAVKVAGVLANPDDHDEVELRKAKARFRELYVAELSLVEGIGVEKTMIALAKVIDKDLVKLDDKQKAAYNLAHALRDSLKNTWGFSEALVDNPN